MIDNLTFDFETYADDKYTLKKLTTEEYINDERFEVLCVAVKRNDDPTECFSGTFEETKKFLAKFDWSNSYALAHNTKFDGAILTWLFGIQPLCWLDSMSMGQAVFGSIHSTSLGAMAKSLLNKQKGTALQSVVGMNRQQIIDSGLMQNFKKYCINDVELTWQVFAALHSKFPTVELLLIDITLNMFINPKLILDEDLLKKRKDAIVKHKASLLQKVGVPATVLNSNQQFEAELKKHGVAPLTSYAKTNPKFMALGNHPNPKVRDLFNARIVHKSAIEEKRIEEFLDVGVRNDSFPIPLKYYGTHTGRWSGIDKVNLQNLPNGSKTLKQSLKAPDGYVLVEADSKQIEARVLVWLAGQNDVVAKFKNGEDVYRYMASKIYNKPESTITPNERKVGKVTVLGCGYGMSPKTFHQQLINSNCPLPLTEAANIVKTYRQTHNKVVNLWSEANSYIRNLCLYNSITQFGKAGVIKANADGLVLPNGLPLYYLGLTHKFNISEDRDEFFYQNRLSGATKIYGAKVVENVTQALARIIIGEQIKMISKHFDVVLTVHDSVVCLVPEADQFDAFPVIERFMNTVPAWASGLPIEGEIKAGKNYGDLYEIEYV
jgi:DNA polymerase